MVSTIKFSEFSNGGDLSNDVTTVGLDGTLTINTRFNNPWTFLPDGSTGTRPVPSPSIYFRLRLNTTLSVYEYYDPGSATWTQLSGSGTGTVNPGSVNDIPFYAANGTALSPLASNALSVLVTNAGSVPSLSTTLPIGLSIPGAIITTSTAALTAGSVIAAPIAGIDLVNKTYADGLFGSGVTSITGTTNQVIASSPTGAVTLSLPQDIALGSTPTFGGLTLTSIPLGVSSGGTGVSSVTTSPTATAFAGWDANSNLSANSFINGFATTATAGATTTLTVASKQIQEFTGTLTQTVTLPVTSTLVAGQNYYIINNSSGVVTVQSSGANTVLAMAANTSAIITCVLNSGTTAASWNASYIVDAGGGVSPGTANQLAYYAVTGNTVSGLTSANNGLLVTSNTGVPSILAGPGTTGNILQSNAAAAPSFSTATYPSTAGTSGNVLTSNGTNFTSAAPATFGLINIQTFSASGTYTPTANMKYCIIEVVGSGGGGGGSANSGAGALSSGAGGGSGSYARKFASAATIGVSQTVTIGAGGLAGANTGAAGGNGNDSSVGTICIGKAGTGGPGATAGGSGGAGGVAGTGDVTIVGNGGGPAGSDSIATSSGGSFPGAPSYFGGAGVGIALTTSNGSAGARGAGGGGGVSRNAGGAVTGGAGGDGYVVITEYI